MRQIPALLLFMLSSIIDASGQKAAASRDNHAAPVLKELQKPRESKLLVRRAQIDRDVAIKSMSSTVSASGVSKATPFAAGSSLQMPHTGADKRPTIAIVVVHCNETLEWMKELPHMVPPALFQTPRVHLIEQCHHEQDAETSNVPNISNMEVSYRKNTGMAPGGYLHHIIESWSHLEDYTVFTESKHDTASMCEWPQFLRLALKRGYAGIGHYYGLGSKTDRLIFPDCPTMQGQPHILNMIPLKLEPYKGKPKAIFGSQFIASRKAVQFTPLSVYHQIYNCLQLLPEKVRPHGLTKEEWEERIPGQQEAGMFESFGSRLFGVANIDRQNVTRLDINKFCHHWDCCEKEALQWSLDQMGGDIRDPRVKVLSRKLLS